MQFTVDERKTALAAHLCDRTPSYSAPGEALWTLDDAHDPAGDQSGTAAFEDMYPRSETIADARWPDTGT